MYKRLLSKQLIEAATYYPVVTLTGPRQSGKTTLVRETFAHYHYVNLEDPETLEQIELDPKYFLRRHQQGLIIDEIQNFPKLLSYIQPHVDENPKKGQFVLTGSHQFALLDAVNQSLAGRTDLLTLYPLCIQELSEKISTFDTDDWLLHGFYPRIYADNIPPNRNSKNYISTYVERDVRKIINIKDIRTFQKFIKLCAGRIGQVLNIESLCNETGITHNTAKSWLSVLEASHIIYILKPYHANLGKRLIKSPKIYFVDVGLACQLLGISEKSHLDNHPLRGMLFENLVVMELIKAQSNHCLDVSFSFYRDNNQNEVDIIIEKGNELLAIEIKSSETFNRKFLKGLEHFSQLAKNPVQSYLVYAGEALNSTPETKIIHYTNCYDILV